MTAIKEFLAKKGFGFYWSVASLLFGLIGFIVYTARGGNGYSPLSQTAIILYVFALITNGAILYKDFKVGAFVPYILYIVTFGVLLNSEMVFITNVIGGIDKNVFDTAWIAFFVCLFLGMVASFAACVCSFQKKGKPAKVAAH